MDGEDELVERAAEGDADALEHLIRDVDGSLRSSTRIQPIWARSLDLEDVLQVTYLEAFLRISGLRDRTRAGFLAWIRQSAENNLKDAIRALERDKRPDPRRRTTRGVAGQSARTLLAEMGTWSDGSSSPAELSDELTRMRIALAKLPASYRTVVEEVDLNERDVADVAEEMGRSRGAVHLLRSRAHDRLRELLSD